MPATTCNGLKLAALRDKLQGKLYHVTLPLFDQLIFVWNVESMLSDHLYLSLVEQWKIKLLVFNANVVSSYGAKIIIFIYTLFLCTPFPK